MSAGGIFATVVKNGEALEKPFTSLHLPVIPPIGTVFVIPDEPVPQYRLVGVVMYITPLNKMNLAAMEERIEAGSGPFNTLSNMCTFIVEETGTVNGVGAE
jgi:hypothetical protein